MATTLVLVPALRSFGKAAILLLSLAVLVMWGVNGNAATITSTAAGGDWHTGTTWVGGAFPKKNDSAIIATTGAGVVTLRLPTTVAALTINAGSVLDLTSLQISTSGVTNISGTINLGTNNGSSFTGLVTLNNTGTWNNSNNVAINFQGGLTVNGGTFTAGSGIYTFDTNNQAIGGTSAITIPNVTVTAIVLTNNGTLTIGTDLTGTGTLTNIGTLNIGGTSTVTTLSASAIGNTVNYSGAAQTIKAPTAAGYYHLTLSGSGAKTTAANLLISGNLTLSGTATFTAGTSLTHTIAGSFIVNTTAATPLTWTTTSIFNFNTPGTPAQTTIGGSSVATLAFNTVNINNTSGVSVVQNISANGTLTINAGATLSPTAATIVSGTGTLTGTGTAQVTTLAAGGFNVQYTQTTKTLTNLTIDYVGAAAQTVTALTYGSATGGGLRVSNASGVVLAGNTTVAGTLNLANGVVNEGAFTLITTGNCTTTVLRTSGWVAGAAGLQLSFPTGAPSCTFHVGDTTTYRPINMTFASVTTLGSLVGQVSQVVGDHPNIATSGLDSTKSVNRFWTVTDSVGGTIVYTTYSATFNFVAVDYDVGANTGNFEAEFWNGTAWTVTSLGARSATSNQAASINRPSAANSFAAFAVAEKKPTAPGQFNVYDTTTAANAIGGNIQTKIAGAAFNLDIIALNFTKTAILPTFAGTVRVELLDSSDDSAALDANACRSTWVPSTLAAIPNQTFAAGDLGRHRINGIVEANAWRNVRVRISFPAVLPTAFGCSTDRFAIRPNTLTVTATDANSSTAGPGRMLNVIAATGGVVHKAGQPFTFSATAVNAAGVPAVTTNYAGTPTPVLTACGGSGCTASFGTLTPGASFVAGVLNSATATYSEVGSFNVQLQDTAFASVDSGDGTPADCTATGSWVCSAITPIGRFVPDHFVAATNNAPTLKTFNNAACATRSFTYIGQLFAYVTAPQALVTAQNASNVTTVNYSNSLWKITTAAGAQVCTTGPDTCALTSGNITQSYTYTTVPVATPNWDSTQVLLTTPTVTANNNGTGTLTTNATDTLAFLHSTTTPQALFTANITLTDSVADNSENAVVGNGIITTTTPATFNPIAFDSGNEFRYGRMKLSNALGSEQLNLPIPIETQYWNGSAFVTNTADNCTTLTANNIKLTAPPAGVSATVGGSFVSGVGSLTLTNPTTPAKVAVDLCVDLGVDVPLVCSATAAAGAPYLQGAWTGATYDDDPFAKASFGVYKGNNDFIYLRENY